jgi:hypothetical protein
MYFLSNTKISTFRLLSSIIINYSLFQGKRDKNSKDKESLSPRKPGSSTQSDHTEDEGHQSSHDGGSHSATGSATSSAGETHSHATSSSSATGSSSLKGKIAGGFARKLSGAARRAAGAAGTLLHTSILLHKISEMIRNVKI